MTDFLVRTSKQGGFIVATLKEHLWESELLNGYACSMLPEAFTEIEKRCAAEIHIKQVKDSLEKKLESLDRKIDTVANFDEAWKTRTDEFQTWLDAKLKENRISAELLETSLVKQWKNYQRAQAFATEFLLSLEQKAKRLKSEADAQIVRVNMEESNIGSRGKRRKSKRRKRK